MIIAYLKHTAFNTQRYDLNGTIDSRFINFGNSLPTGCIELPKLTRISKNVVYEIHIKHIKVVRESSNLYPNASAFDDGYRDLSAYKTVKMVVSKVKKVGKSSDYYQDPADY